MVIDGSYTFGVHRVVESQYYTPETNLTLCANCTSIQINQSVNHDSITAGFLGQLAKSKREESEEFKLSSGL